jgi:hypothetical protein
MNIESLYKPSAEEISSVEWSGDPVAYDLELYELGNSEPKFLIVNPYISDDLLIHYINDLPDTPRCVVWSYNGEWVAKLFTKGWIPSIGYENINLVKPKMSWNRNPDLDKLMRFNDDPFGSFDPGPWDCNYKLIWHIDPRFNPLPDKVWAVSCQPIGKPVQGTKEMGYLTPDVTVEFNEHLPNLEIDIDQCYPPFWELASECAYELDPVHQVGERLWVLKFTPNYRKPRGWKWLGVISPQYKVEYNPDLPRLNYILDYVVPWHDLDFEHVWMLDRQHLKNNEDDIWAVKIKFVKKPVGSKVVDYITPEVKIEYNEFLPQLEYDIEYEIPWHDLGFEHVWMLDRKHLKNGEDDIWAMKASCTKRVSGTKIVDQVSPKLIVEVNPDLKGYSFDVDYVVPYHDFEFDHVWMLDNEYSQGYDIWAVKLKTGQENEQWKEVGTITPSSRVTYNPDLKDLKIAVDYKIPYHDRKYLHVWYLDTAYSNGEKIWAAKVQSSERTSGEKEMGYVTPLFPDRMDVVFISYNEQDAESNWQRVLEKAPWAKRVSGVKGIFEAHKAAAKLAQTDMFYVVDGDAYLVDNWQFNYQPGIFDRDCTYIWYAKNSVNNLTYGYGGVKLFPRKKLLEKESWSTLDLSTSVSDKIKIIETVSNYTNFNTDPFSTWRSVFRECVKLFVSNYEHPETFEHQLRLDQWLEPKKDIEYSDIILDAANKAVEFARSNVKKKKQLVKINDRDWLESQFKNSKA